MISRAGARDRLVALTGQARPLTASEEKKFSLIQEACIKANADGFISKLPQGYDTVVGERGKLVWSLSGRYFEHCDESGKQLERQSFLEFPRNQAFLDERPLFA